MDSGVARKISKRSPLFLVRAPGEKSFLFFSPSLAPEQALGATATFPQWWLQPHKHLKLRKNPPWPKELDKGQRALGESQLLYFPFLFSHFFAAEEDPVVGSARQSRAAKPPACWPKATGRTPVGPGNVGKTREAGAQGMDL